MLRVLHWQASGVAWVPWRMHTAIQEHGSGTVETHLTGGPVAELLECYGLPNPVQSVRDPWGWEGDDPDIVHLHHVFLTQRLTHGIRRRWGDRVKIVVTCHGEPDRSRHSVARDVDAIHVVAPDLLRLYPDATFIPNHPVVTHPPTQDSWWSVWGTKVLYVPFSHVGRFKDWGILGDAVPFLEDRGWEIHRARSILPNEENLDAIARSAAVWVQLQGYLDLTVMEAWSLGSIPVVCMAQPAQWSAALGVAPLVLFSERCDLTGEQVALAVDNAVSHDQLRSLGRVIMEKHWTPHEYARALESFYWRTME